VKFPVLKNKEIREVKRKGKKFSSLHLEWRVLFTHSSYPPRIVINAHRHCGKAVRRNYLRRIVREWIKGRYSHFPSGTHLFVRIISSPPSPKEKWREEIERELEEIWERFKEEIPRGTQCRE